MVDEDRITRIAEAIETEAQGLMNDGNFAAATALFTLAETADGDTLLRFADIVIQAEAVAGYIP